MKILASLLLFVSSGTLFAQNLAQSYQVRGGISTESSYRGDKIEKGNRDVRHKEKEQVLKMEIRRMNPNAPSNAKVYWILAMDDMQGRLRPVGGGEQEIHSQVGIPVEITSDSISVKERDWKRKNGKSGGREQDLKGYAVLVVDSEGNELGFKCSPNSLESKSRSYFSEELAKDAEKEERQEERAAKRNAGRQKKNKGF